MVSIIEGKALHIMAWRTYAVGARPGTYEEGADDVAVPRTVHSPEPNNGWSYRVNLAHFIWCQVPGLHVRISFYSAGSAAYKL